MGSVVDVFAEVAMISSRWLQCLRILLPVAAALWLGLATAQTAAPSTVASDPIRCWWKTDKTAIQIGERFGLTLTCSVITTSRVSVVPDLVQLEPGTVQLAPFEVLGGVHHQDVIAGMWRYIQFDYTLRLIEDNFFRLDVDIPSLSIAYNVQMIDGAATNQGRDLKYVLRPIPVRINSLVPKDAADIRDASHETFGDIEARAARALNEKVAAILCFSFAVLLFALAVVQAFSHVRARLPVANHDLQRGAVLNGCVRELGRLKSEVSRAGWTAEIAAQAVAVLRVAGALALSKPVAQVVTAGDAASAGQLVMYKGWWRRKRVLVSAAVATSSIAKLLAASSSNKFDAGTRTALEELRIALNTFNAACYGREALLDKASLDQALGHGATALKQLRSQTLWQRLRAGKFSLKSSTPLEEMAWSR